MIRKSSKMKQLARGEEAMTSRLRKERRLDREERETSINETGIEPSVKPLSSSRRTRHGIKIRTAPLKRPQATGVRSRLYSSNWPSIPKTESPRETGDKTKKLYLDLFFVKDRRERSKKREKLRLQYNLVFYISFTFILFFFTFILM